MQVSARWFVVTCLVVAAGATAEAGTYSDAVLGTSGVVAYYKMDEDNATEVGDPLINAVSPGTLDGLWGYESGDPDTMPSAGVTGPSAATGFAGLDEGNFAAYFGGNGADDNGDGDPTNNVPDQMDLGTRPEFDNEFATIAFFMQTPGGGNDGRVFTSAQSAANTFRIIYGPANAYSELAVVTSPNSGSTASQRTEGIVVGDDAWHHVVVVRNGDNAEDAQIYVDGVDASAAMTDTGDSYGDSDVTARIASRHGWSNYGWGSYTGTLDEFAYWNRALSAAEVQMIWGAAGGGGGVTLFGDVNLDGVVNGLDVDPFVGVLLTGPFQDEADMNADGVVNGLDVDLFVAAVVGGGVQSVPEPSALVLLSLGLITWVLFGRRQRP